MTRLRRALILLGLVPFVLALAFAVKVGLMLSHDRDGRAALDDADPRTAQAEFAANARLNVLESWVAPYDEGVARFVRGDHSGAVALFSTALPLAPADEVCRVRVNLALSHEAVGDAALTTASGQLGDALAQARETARQAWGRGRAVLATGDCLTGSSTEPRDPLATSVDDRLAGKLADDTEDQPDQGEDDQQQGQGQTPREKRQESELAERNDSGQQQRQRREQAQQEREERQDQQGSVQSGGRGNGGGQLGEDPGAPPAISW